MRKNRRYFVFFLTLATAFFYWPIRPTPAATPIEARLAGRILLQTEAKGQAWYIHPATHRRHYLGRPADAFRLMRELGIGITDADLQRIGVDIPATAGPDADGDGLGDALEGALGTDPRSTDTDFDRFDDRGEVAGGFDPLGTGRSPLSNSFARAQAGKILLQVQGQGEAWYVDPVTLKRRYLGRPADAFALMRALGLGISNRDLSAIVVASPDLPADEFERTIFDLINVEREKAGLKALIWNDELATVARRHGNDLAAENGAFTGFGMSCDYPFIHHEGVNFGLTNGDRLASAGIHYYSRAGENIALLTAAQVSIRTSDPDRFRSDAVECESRRDQFEADYQAAIKDATDEAKAQAVRDSTAARAAAFAREREMAVSKADWTELKQLAADMVKGWMESPGHKANILTAEFSETGIGFARVNGYIFGTQVFIQRAGCGYEDGPCCAEPGYRPYCYVPLGCSAGVCGR